MKKIIKGMISAVCLTMYIFLLGNAFAAQTDQTGLVDDSAKKPSTALAQDSKEISKTEKKNLMAESAFHRFIKRAKGNLTLFGQRLAFVFSSYSEAPAEMVKALNHLTGRRGLGHLAKLFLLFLLLIAIGFGMERIFNIPIKKYKQQLQSTIPKSFFQLIARLSARTVLELISFAVFALTIIGLYLLFYPTHSPLYELAMIYLPPIFIIRIAFIGLNALYSPTAPHMRISPQNCPSAATYLIGFMTFIIVSLLITKTLLLLRSHGLSEGVFLLFYSHLGIIQFLILLAILWMDRARITRLILKSPNEAEAKSTAAGNKIKRLWFPLACVGLLGFELLWQINLILHQKDLVLPLLLTILSIPFGFLLFSIGNRLLLIASGQTELLDPRIVNQDILPKDADISAFVKIALPPEPVSAGRGDGSSDQKESLFIRHLALIRNLMGILIGCALLFWVMDLWGLDLPLGRSVVRSASSIFATLLLAYVVWEICRTIIDRKLEEDRPQSEQDMEDMEEGAEGSRKGTLLTLLRKVILALIGVIVILIILNAVGINIGPLLAGAGILGLAVGFGSQTLVKDILSGVFFLMDDAFRVGDYIETAGTKGMVEHISLRSLRLRHPRGMVYTIPFGGMGSVQNFSRDYIITKLDVRVRYDVDIEKIRKLVKKMSKELEEDEEIGRVLLSPIKSQGVREMDDSAMILRVKFKTKPGDQFVVRREVYRRIQERFRTEGIEFAHRNVTVYLPPEVNGAEPDGDQGKISVPRSKLDNKVLEAGAAAAIVASQVEAADKIPKK
ncbi:MAG: mechanosensitive ion channel family protein [Deltaproteobacteria bacterium]|nr:mechanosensitive ion channel family protein [Deltaproteobacteria bacterium]